MTAARAAVDPQAALRTGCAAWLRLAASDKAVRQIVLTDAPSVLGWQNWRALESRYSLGLIKTALASAAQAGQVPTTYRLDLYAHLLLAGMIEIALIIARSPHDAALIEAGREATERLLSSLFAAEPTGAAPQRVKRRTRR